MLEAAILSFGNMRLGRGAQCFASPATAHANIIILAASRITPGSLPANRPYWPVAISNFLLEPSSLWLHGPWFAHGHDARAAWLGVTSRVALARPSALALTR